MTEPAVLFTIAALQEGMAILCRHIYAHPELGFREWRTAVPVVECPEVWGYQASRGVGHTGMVGTLCCGEGSALGLRTDVGALPIQEATDLPHASQVDGVMRTCGHDGYTVMFLAAAKHLVESSHWRGTLQLIFRPAEESLDGARVMFDDRLLEHFPCGAIFAMRNTSGYPAGHLNFHPGLFIALADTMVIRVIGSGDHGMMPQCTVDPVVVCSAIVLALQDIVSRSVDPQDTAIVSVGVIHVGTISSAIPVSVGMILSVYALTAETRALLERCIGELARGQVASFGVRVEVDYRYCRPVLVNHPGQTAFACEMIRDWLGEECPIDGLRPFTASEDFVFILERCPGSYLVIGNGQSESGCRLHNPGYDFNGDCLTVGANYWVRLTECFLA